jgi:hypothetical protein
MDYVRVIGFSLPVDYHIYCSIQVFIYGINPKTLKKEKFAMEMNIISNDSMVLNLGGRNLEFKRDKSDIN